MENPQGIKQVEIADRMESAFLDYAMSVIVSRALPDVKDGLKPVQRRILYAMYEANLHADRPHRKCASVIGDVMKKYHPHGDSSIYEALVRMAQDFSTREPLIDGRGNFGSIDGDSAAAFRYTESRLSPLAMHMLADIDDNTVDYSANYDGHEMAPDILPSRFPNLLVNGATGIAVGFSTNIAPHNLVETIRACQLLIKHPDSNLDEIMQVLPAPDFPTGGRIKHTDGIKQAFKTGRGAITMEAVAATEVRSGGIPRIVVTEIPYQVNKATLLTKIADLVKTKKIDSIRDLRDESSRDGMRIVIELKRGEDVQDTLKKLYRWTDLQSNFTVNMVALDNGKPKQLSLIEILHAYLAHQRDVITRRTQYRLDGAKKRLHIIDGLLIALDNIDEVIRLIRESDSTAQARLNLMDRFSFSELQANAVLEMQLRRLARLETSKLQQEQEMLAALVAQYQEILANPDVLDQVLHNELDEIATQHGNPRRSVIVGQDDDIATTIPVLAAQEVTTYIFADGGIKPVAKKAYTDAYPGNDPLVAIVHGPADDNVLVIDEQGGGYFVSPQDIGVMTIKQRPAHIRDIVEQPAAPIAGAVVLPPNLNQYNNNLAEDGTPEPSVITVSEQGFCKRTFVSDYDVRNRSVVAATTRKNDRIMTAFLSYSDDDLIMLSSSKGQAIVFPVSDIRPSRRAASGVGGIKISGKSTVVAATCIVQTPPPPAQTVLQAAATGATTGAGSSQAGASTGSAGNQAGSTGSSGKQGGASTSAKGHNNQASSSTTVSAKAQDGAEALTLFDLDEPTADSSGAQTSPSPDAQAPDSSKSQATDMSGTQAPGSSQPHVPATAKGNVPGHSTGAVVFKKIDVTVIAKNGAVKRVPLEAFPVQSRNGKGVLTGVGSLAFAGVSEVVHIKTEQGWSTLRTETLPAMVRSRTPDPNHPGSKGNVIGQKCVPEPLDQHFFVE